MPDGAEASVYPLPYGLKDEDYKNWDNGVTSMGFSDGAISASHNFDFPDFDELSLDESEATLDTIITVNGDVEAVYELKDTVALRLLPQKEFVDLVTQRFGESMDTTLGKFTLRPATTPPASGMCIAIYGAAGVGKTTLAAQAALSPLGNPVLIIDAEGGSRAVAHMENVYVADVKTWKEIVEVSTEVAKSGSRFKTIVLDNMSEFQQLNLRGIVGQGMPQIQHYGQNTSEMLNFSRLWRDISRDIGVNVIFIAWESPEKDESTGIIKRDLGFTPSLAKQFPGIIDIVGYLTVDNKGLRVLNFAPSVRTAAKFRRSQSEVAMQIPLQLTYGLNEYPMVDLLNTLKGGLEWPAGRYLQKRPE